MNNMKTTQKMKGGKNKEMEGETKKKMEIYREELLRIAREGRLTAKNVVEEAQNEDSPLHNLFTWDNDVAAEKWRLHQATMLINYVIEPSEDEGKEKIYSFEIVNMNGSKEYKHINEILSKREWRDQILNQATTYLANWKNKYNRYNIKKLQPVISEIEKLENDER
jgi:glycine cleavage system protein P-like pyridoxal-binding family